MQAYKMQGREKGTGLASKTGYDTEQHSRIYRFEPLMADRGSQVPQFAAAIAVNLISMAAGCVMGWSSPVLPKLKMADSFLPITEENGSWMGSLVPLGAALGSFPGGLLADKIGRKWALLSLVVPFVLSWCLIIFAESVLTIYSARIIAGFAIGALFTVVPMYIGEISEDSIRGALGSFLNAFFNVGIFYAYVIGMFVSYTCLGVASVLIPGIFVVVFVFMPDSPYYLLSHGNKEGASKALQSLRRKTGDGVAKELEQMQMSVDESSRHSTSFKDLFATRSNFKALYLSCGLSAFQQLSGINVILYYSTDIFQEAGGSLSSEISSIIVAAVLLGSSFCTPWLVEKLGRRMLLFFSATGMAIAQATIGVYFFLKSETTTDLTNVGWLPIACLVVNIAANSIGLGPLPWAVMGELFPSNVKGIAAATTASFNWVLCFLITKFFQNIVVALGIYTAFWIFAVCCVLADIFVFFLLPETKGRSLQAIQDSLCKK